ncbi:MAG TPA: hypothetical protein VFW00_04545 [Rhodocyclaceae bacterium]|nr:hypothetical protein [Rhodocyclaceae bacterium]
MSMYRINCSILAALLTVLAMSLLSACHTISGEFPRNKSLVPDADLHIFPGYRLALDDAIMIAGVAYLVYQVVDPLAPNWDIHETRLANNRVLYNMNMQRVHGGGDGEARQVLARRAAALAREEGFAGYEIHRYEESLDSRILFPHRTVEAEITLIAAPPKQAVNDALID